VGAGAAVLGLAAVSGIGFGEGIHPLGLLFGLGAAVGNAAYYATAAATDHGVPPLPFVGLGLCVAAVLLAIVSAVGLLPFTMSSAPVLLAGAEVSPALAITGMVLISTVIAYVLGVAASRRLGAMLASFTGYSEPIFGIFWTILVLSILPTGMQWIGAALIICGLVAVKAGELLQSRRGAAAAGRPGSRSGRGDTDRLSPSKTG
jgi:drug/metabolite transporter (DMT)-like permease